MLGLVNTLDIISTIVYGVQIEKMTMGLGGLQGKR
jgi:hypothetical protein